MQRQRALGIVSAALFMVLAESASADVHQVGDAFFNGNRQEAGNDAFVFATSDGTPGFAGLVASITMDSNQPPDKLVVVFQDKAEWGKFVALWRKAVQAATPSQDDAYKTHDNTDDSYFDPDSEVEVTVSKDTDGGIDFAFAGKPDSHNSPSVIGIISVPKTEFEKFEKDVAAVSAFFDAK